MDVAPTLLGFTPSRKQASFRDLEAEHLAGQRPEQLSVVLECEHDSYTWWEPKS